MADYLSIGGNRRPLSEVSPSWISQQFRDRRVEGAPICIEFHLDDPGLTLRGGTCPPSGFGAGGQLNARQQRLYDLWRRRGLTDAEPTPGQLKAFLAQLSSVI